MNQDKPEYDYTESDAIKRERKRQETEAHNKMWDKIIDRILNESRQRQRVSIEGRE